MHSMHHRAQIMFLMEKVGLNEHSGKSYIGRVDLPGLQHAVLLESETPSFEGIQWDTPDQLRLFDEAGKQWQYDFATQQLQPSS